MCLPEETLMAHIAWSSALAPQLPTIASIPQLCRRTTHCPPSSRPRITRNFNFDRDNGQWVINDKFANCNEIRFAVTQEQRGELGPYQPPRRLAATQSTFTWKNTQILSRAQQRRASRQPQRRQVTVISRRLRNFGGGGGGISTTRPGVPNVEVSRKDVTRLQFR